MARHKLHQAAKKMTEETKEAPVAKHKFHQEMKKKIHHKKAKSTTAVKQKPIQAADDMQEDMPEPKLADEKDAAPEKDTAKEQQVAETKEPEVKAAEPEVTK